MENGNGIAWQPDITKPDEIKIRIDEILTAYCLEVGKTPEDAPPLLWNGALLEVNEKFFRVFNRLLKDINGSHNEYNFDSVYIIYIIYKKLCLKYNKIPNLKGFIDYSGIDKQSIYNWSSEKLGSRRFDLHEIIMNDNETSLEAKLQEKGQNPMSILPILNHRYNWSLPGTTKEVIDKRQLSTRSDLVEITAADSPKLPE